MQRPGVLVEIDAVRRDAIRPAVALVVRGGALFLGLYALCSLAMSLLGGVGYDANIWWIDLRALPAWLRFVLLFVFAAALLHRAAWPVASGPVRRMRWIVLCALVLILLGNSAVVWGLHLEHVSQSAGRSTGVRLGLPVPLTAVLAVGVMGMCRSACVSSKLGSARRAWRVAGVLGVAAVLAVAGALAQMFAFGATDYRRPADAIVVYGCKAYPNGQPSQALADRVHTACELYHQGLAPRIVMSGGPVSISDWHETQVMADYAVSLGVPREAIVLDREGLDTQATATNLPRLLGKSRGTPGLRVLAVSHDYHLPRVKLSLERQGLRAYTVPCEVRRGMPGRPYFMAREAAAWWYYYLSPVVAAG